MVNDPSILFADEPTGNLDSKNGEIIIALLLDLAKADGRTLAVVTHDDRLAARGDRTVRIVDGRLAED
jgi:predicted ABC-type transport system involved in lysophospholipase L1 biosynthesis ATPase subunit